MRKPEKVEEEMSKLPEGQRVSTVEVSCDVRSTSEFGEVEPGVALGDKLESLQISEGCDTASSGGPESRNHQRGVDLR